MISLRDLQCEEREAPDGSEPRGCPFPQGCYSDVRAVVRRIPIELSHVEELRQERGVNVDHATINRWVVKHSPQAEEAFHRRKRPVWLSWRMDETSIEESITWSTLPDQL
jgi:transposase-like protein